MGKGESILVFSSKAKINSQAYSKQRESFSNFGANLIELILHA